MPKVSVIMPVYNGEKYLGCAIESVLNQTYKDFELIIIDDGSIDGSANIVSQYADPRITLIQNESNFGTAVTRNVGLANANGKYVALLDCDDIASPDRLSVQIDFLENHREIVMIGSRVAIIDEDGNSTGMLWEYPAPAAQIPSILLFHNYFAQSAICARMSCLVQNRYRPEYPLAEDYDLWVRVARMGKVWNLPKCLVQYREHPGGISKIRADALERSVVMILKNLLNDFGVEATSDEIHIHRRVGDAFACDWTLQQLDELEAWLMKLEDVNDRARVFPVDIFKRQLGDRWFAACSAANIGLQGAHRKYSSSRLSHIISDAPFRTLRVGLSSFVWQVRRMKGVATR